MRICATPFLVAFGLLLLLLSACGPGDEDIGQTEEGALALGRAEVEAVVERGVVPGRRTLVLRGFSGQVRLTGTNAEAARLEFVKQARGEDDEAAREVLSGIQIEERGDEEEYVYTVNTEAPERTGVIVRGTVPYGTRLRIALESGPVRLSGIDGPIQVETNGDVEIAGAAEDVEAITQNGDLLLGLHRLPPNAEARLRTSNGDIALTIPGQVSARVRAQTGAGEILVEGLDFTNRQLEPEDAGAVFSGQLGSGNALIEAQTQNGDILLEEGTMLVLPPDEETEGEASEALPRRDTARPPRSPLDSMRQATPTDPDTTVLTPPDTTRRDTLRRDTTGLGLL